MTAAGVLTASPRLPRSGGQKKPEQLRWIIAIVTASSQQFTPICTLILPLGILSHEFQDKSSGRHDEQ
jgi:hypothetical protein